MTIIKVIHFHETKTFTILVINDLNTKFISIEKYTNLYVGVNKLQELLSTIEYQQPLIAQDGVGGGFTKKKITHIEHMEVYKQHPINFGEMMNCIIESIIPAFFQNTFANFT